MDECYDDASPICHIFDGAEKFTHEIRTAIEEKLGFRRFLQPTR